MRLVTVGSVAFDAIESPFGKTDKIVGGAGTFITLASSFFVKEQGIISVVGVPARRNPKDSWGRFVLPGLVGC